MFGFPQKNFFATGKNFLVCSLTRVGLHEMSMLAGWKANSMKKRHCYYKGLDIDVLNGWTHIILFCLNISPSFYGFSNSQSPNRLRQTETDTGFCNL